MEVDRDSQEEEVLITHGCINVDEAELRDHVLLSFRCFDPLSFQISSAWMLNFGQAQLTTTADASRRHQI